MARKYGNERSESVSFRVTKEEKARLLKESGAVGVSLSDYARARTLGERPTDLRAAAMYAATTSDPAAMHEALDTQLGAVTEAINQARRALGQKEK